MTATEKTATFTTTTDAGEFVISFDHADAYNAAKDIADALLAQGSALEAFRATPASVAAELESIVENMIEDGDDYAGAVELRFGRNSVEVAVA